MIECGEVYYIKNVEGKKKKDAGCETWAGRPGIVISSEENIRENGTVAIIFLTSSDKDKGLSVFISDNAFKYKKNPYEAHQALCAQVHTVDKSRLGTYYGKVSNEELEKIRDMVINKALF